MNIFTQLTSTAIMLSLIAALVYVFGTSSVCDRSNRIGKISHGIVASVAFLGEKTMGDNNSFSASMWDWAGSAKSWSFKAVLPILGGNENECPLSKDVFFGQTLSTQSAIDAVKQQDDELYQKLVNEDEE